MLANVHAPLTAALQAHWQLTGACGRLSLCSEAGYRCKPVLQAAGHPAEKQCWHPAAPAGVLSLLHWSGWEALLGTRSYGRR